VEDISKHSEMLLSFQTNLAKLIDESQPDEYLDDHKDVI
jgi:hypothetical protein